MTKLTIIIPIAPHHEAVSHQAYASAMAQTIPCEIIPLKDADARGAGWTRNQGLAKASCEWVTFLDADDVIDPRFAEITLGILEEYARSHSDPRYAYTDWLVSETDAVRAPDPCEVWTHKTAHLVTAVVPTQAARRIGGFDEAMLGVEDADFYVRLRLSGLCGLHINAPLVHYREGGQRSVTARANGDETRALQYMAHRYGGYNLMGCCGDTTQGPTGPMNEPQEGDVLAQVLWGGNRQERGRITGRLYPRSSAPKMMYVAEVDVNASPALWRRVTSPTQAANGVVLQPSYSPTQGRPWQETMTALYGPQAQTQPIEYKPPVSGRKKADVIAKAQE